jgi:hypothetical protein
LCAVSGKFEDRSRSGLCTINNRAIASPGKAQQPRRKRRQMPGRTLIRRRAHRESSRARKAAPVHVCRIDRFTLASLSSGWGDLFAKRKLHRCDNRNRANDFSLEFSRVHCSLFCSPYSSALLVNFAYAILPASVQQAQKYTHVLTIVREIFYRRLKESRSNRISKRITSIFIVFYFLIFHFD